MAKMKRTVTLEDDQIEWLEKAARKYNLPNADKALRALLDYVTEEGDQDHIFETIRCRHC